MDKTKSSEQQAGMGSSHSQSYSFNEWSRRYPGPYTTRRIGGITTYQNPFEHMPFVYFDGLFLESNPMQIDIMFPTRMQGRVVVDLAKEKQ